MNARKIGWAFAVIIAFIAITNRHEVADGGQGEAPAAVQPAVETPPPTEEPDPVVVPTVPVVPVVPAVVEPVVNPTKPATVRYVRRGLFGRRVVAVHDGDNMRAGGPLGGPVLPAMKKVARRVGYRVTHPFNGRFRCR